MMSSEVGSLYGKLVITPSPLFDIIIWLDMSLFVIFFQPSSANMPMAYYAMPYYYGKLLN